MSILFLLYTVKKRKQGHAQCAAHETETRITAVTVVVLRGRFCHRRRPRHLPAYVHHARGSHVAAPPPGLLGQFVLLHKSFKTGSRQAECDGDETERNRLIISMGERGSDLKSMEARDNVRGAGDHVNGELFSELRIDAGEDEETDEISSNFKASCTM